MSIPGDSPFGSQQRADAPIPNPPGFTPQPAQPVMASPVQQTTQTIPTPPAPKKDTPLPDMPEAEVPIEYNTTDRDPGDTTPQDPSSIEIDVMIKESAEALESGTREAKNTDKLPLAIPLSTLEMMNMARDRELGRDPDTIRDRVADVTSAFSTFERTFQFFSDAIEGMTEAIKSIGDTSKLKLSKGGVGDSNAALSSKFRGQKEFTLDDSNAFMTMATMTGGMRRITLWNSGFSITIRKLPLTLLNNFYNDIHTDSYEYGREFGALYYYFSDIRSKQHIIEKLLPIAICSSSYVHWRDTDKLLSAISLQDYDTIVWGLCCMMHPNGAYVHFACGEPDCDHVEHVTSDLSKLRLINDDLVNVDMINHFKVPGMVTDENLQRYRQVCNLGRTLTFEHGEGRDWRKWELNLRQISLADHLAIAKDYNGELQKYCKLNNYGEVSNYNSYNIQRSYKPWIESLKMTFDRGDGPQTAKVINTGTQQSDESIYMALDMISQNCADFSKKIREYITSTKISHIAFYMPKCPKCGREPKTGYHGYIPFDASQNFFTLALMALLQDSGRRERQNTTKDTKSS